MKSHRISFLVHDLGAPTLGAAVRLAASIKHQYEVEIVGADIGYEVCSLYRDAADYRAVPCPHIHRLPDFLWESLRLARAPTGDIIIAVKAYANTLPVALWAKWRYKKKVIAYLDEWDGALFRQFTWPHKVRRVLRHFYHPMEEIYPPLVEQLILYADEVISTTTFLQKRFGGKIINLGVDTDFFKPQPEDMVLKLKAALGFSHLKLLVFGGVVRAHKGIESFLEALKMIGDPTIVLLIIGPETDHLRVLMNNPSYRPYLRCVGAPTWGKGSSLNSEVHQRMPEYLALGDILLVPLSDSLLAQSQMPCKVFEAMAMGKPILASDVSDLPLLLDGCGWITPPNDIDSIIKTIQYIFNHPEEGRKKGMATRQKCQQNFSCEQTGKELSRVISDLLVTTKVV